MKMLFRCLILLACLCVFALPALAGESDDYEQDARYAEGTPPMVPHSTAGMTSESCLACHRTGLNGAPVSPHPVRLDCTQCHGQGEIKAGKGASKSEKKSKKKSKEAVKE